MKKRGILAALLMGTLMFAGCTGGRTASEPLNSTGSSADSTTGGAKPVILCVSFGTSYNDSRAKTIDAIEQAVSDSFGDYEERRAFTADTIINKLRERDGLEIDNVDGAFEKLVSDGVKVLVVQPTHVMSGYEYDDLIAAVNKNKDKFDKVSVGTPLLTSDDDYSRVADALIEDTGAVSDDETAIVFMGHGTEHEANAAYAKLQQVFSDKGAKNIIVGTVEATPGIDDVVKAVRDGGYKKVVLQPLMVVAGDHANNDMAGDEDDSWKSILEKEGFEVQCSLKGMGEIEAIRNLYVDHVNAAIKELG